MSCENGWVKGDLDDERHIPEGGIGPKQELKLLEGVALSVFMVAILGAFGFVALQSEILHSGQSAAIITPVLVDLANEDRSLNHLNVLTVNPLLVEAAQQKANDEAARGYFAHVAPDGKDSWYWFKQAGYTFSYAGENLAVDFNDSGDVEKAWMNSPTHRANLLNPHFTEIGIAAAQGVYQGRPTIFVVQMFGAPAIDATQADISTETVPQEPTKPALASATNTTRSSAENVLGATAPVKVSQDPGNAVSTPKPVAGSSVIEKPMPRYSSLWQFLLSSPKRTLQYAYYTIGFLILIALLMTTGFEFRLHHARKFAAAGALFVIMCGLFVIADAIMFGDPSVAVAASQQTVR